MTIVVDQIRTYPLQSIKPAARRYGSRWCHLMNDGDRQELHMFAAKMGLPRSWFQEHPVLWHYDLTPRLRQKAVTLGAREVFSEEWLSGDWRQQRIRQRRQEQERHMYPSTRQLRQLLDPLDCYPVECDGFTKLAHRALSANGIPHIVYEGQATYTRTGAQTPIHRWIVAESSEGSSIIDYRARLWLRGLPESRADIPHGIFQAEQYPYIRYEGQQNDAPPIDDSEFAILTAQPYGTLYTIGYSTPGADAYLESLMADGQTDIVEGRYTPYARNRPRWCRYGKQGLAATWGERYLFFSGRTQIASTEHDINWLGNENYKGGPIKIVDLKRGLQALFTRLVLGRNVVLICVCQAGDKKQWRCHLRQIVDELQYTIPGLPIQLQPS